MHYDAADVRSTMPPPPARNAKMDSVEEGRQQQQQKKPALPPMPSRIAPTAGGATPKSSPRLTAPPPTPTPAPAMIRGGAPTIDFGFKSSVTFTASLDDQLANPTMGVTPNQVLYYLQIQRLVNDCKGRVWVATPADCNGILAYRTRPDASQIPMINPEAYDCLLFPMLIEIRAGERGWTMGIIFNPCNMKAKPWELEATNDDRSPYITMIDSLPEDYAWEKEREKCIDALRTFVIIV